MLNIFIPLYTDFIFTDIFNNYKNIDILENFLENYYDLPLNTLKDTLKEYNVEFSNYKCAKRSEITEVLKWLKLFV